MFDSNKNPLGGIDGCKRNVAKKPIDNPKTNW